MIQNQIQNIELNDPEWKHGYWLDLNDKKFVRYKLCNKDLRAEIKRLKDHFVGGYEDVTKCQKVNKEISK